jgi:homoserine kinase
MPTASVTVVVPGSTSNLGPGFDSLGIALQLYNRVRIIQTDGADPVITSPIADSARSGASAIIREAAHVFFRRTRVRRFGFTIHLSGDVPIARGLGSSVTVRLGVMAALDALTSFGASRQDLFQWVTELEGHPDNTAAAVFGAFTASGIIDGQPRAVRLPVPRPFQFVTLIPNFEVSTEAARQLLPATYTRADAVHNLTRATQITAAFARADAEALRGLFADRFHQPYREPLIPRLTHVLRAGQRAGAIGGWLSGSGSTIICLALEKAEAVGRAMLKQMPGSELKILHADTRGFRVRQ